MSDDQLIPVLAQLLETGETMPEPVADAAKALFDWVHVDAALADLVAEQQLTRADEDTLTWQCGTVHIQVQVEPAGYRRRRLVIVAYDEGSGTPADEVDVQRADGSIFSVASDAFGERVTRVPTGAVRILALTSSGAIATQWFTV